jgi:protein TonB
LFRSIYFSIALHAALILVSFVFIRHQSQSKNAPKITWIEVTPPPVETQKKTIDQNRRVVQTEQGERTRETTPDAFLGEHTQTVDRQTVSKNQKIEMGHTHAPVQPKAEKPARAKAEPPQAPSQQTNPIQDLGKLALKIIPAAKPETEHPDWASSGDNAPSDYIKGIKEGERTALNTQEFIFYGYYQRIRERLDRAWVPILRQKLTARFRSGRHIASDSDLTTKVIVVLNAVGEVTHVKVTTESGLTDLDDAAVGAFNLAGPFPNPPHGMTDRDGQIQIPWEFILRS